MLNSLFEWVSRLAASWKFWIVVPPWDIGVRIRWGRWAKALRPGPHGRIPLLDEVVLVNTRLRVDSTPTVTLGTGKPGFGRTASATVGYRVADPVTALMHFTEPGSVLIGLAQRELTRGSSEEMALSALRAEVAQHGIEVEFVYYPENVDLRVLRIMNDAGRVFAGGYGAPVPAGPGATSTSRY